MNTSRPPNKITGPERAAIVVLLLLAFALRTIDLARVPPGMHNDEVARTGLTETVVAGRLAIFFPEDTGNEVLYYYYAAPFIHFFGDTLYALRVPAVFLSLVSMCVIWALARRLFGPTVALVTMAGFAITFWTVEFGRINLQVIMIVPTAAPAAYFFWRAWSANGPRAWVVWALSGLWLGLSINGYTAARVLPVVFLAFALYVRVFHRADWRRWWKGIAIVLMVTAVLAAPLMIYLVRNPGADDLGFFDINRPLVELQKGNPAPIFETSVRTLGMFAFVSDALIYYPIPGRPIFEPIGALLWLAGLIIALRRWRRSEYAFVVLWFFLSLIPGMFSQPAPNSTRTLGAQIVVFALPGIAVAELIRAATKSRRHSKNLVPSVPVWLTAGLVLLFVGNLVWTIRDYFVVWPSIPEVRWWHHSGLYAVANDLQTDPDTSPVAVCLPDELIDERASWWKPGWQYMRYMLHRPDLSLRYYNCVDAMVLVAGPARYAVPDAASQTALQAFPMYAQFVSNANAEFRVLPDGPSAIARADVSAVLAQRLPQIAVESVVAYAPEAGGELAQLPISFGDRVEFLGYTLSPSSFGPHPSSFELTTYWRVTAPLPPQLSQFTHVLDAQGSIVAQQDRLALTSASLRPGDIFAQVHRLTLPDDLPAGEYALSIGLYSYLDGTRLPIMDGGRPRGDRLWLQAIRIGE